MSDDEKWQKTLADLFQPLFDSGIKEIQNSLNDIKESKQKTSALGSFLLHHLVLEKYLENYIIAIFPAISQIDGHKVNFGKKLEIVKKLNQFNHESYSALKAINEIRNDLAHNLSGGEIKEGHKKAIYFIIDRWDKDGRLRQIVDKSSNFYPACETCIYFLLVELLTSITLHGAKRDVEEDFIRQKDLMFKQLVEAKEG
ncbi:MAG: hypothetical protein ACXVCP_09575 [Bdellovibrio sp.]